MLVRKHYIFHGRVQGVGFRFTVDQKALELGLTGWVRNCYDGSVEACFQGENALILQLVEYMYTIRYIHIERMDVETISLLENEKSFQVKF